LKPVRADEQTVVNRARTVAGRPDFVLFEDSGFSDPELKSRKPAKNVGLRYPVVVIVLDIQYMNIT
jgi:hypothetical protein